MQSLPGARLTFPFGQTLSTHLRQSVLQERTLLPLVVLAAYAAYVVAMALEPPTGFVLAFASHGRQRRKALGYQHQDFDRVPDFNQ